MELGSEFDLDLSQLTDTSDTVFAYLKDYHAIYTDSGRSALRLLSGRLQKRPILVPDYICQAVTDALPESCQIIYYPVDRMFRIDMEKLEGLLQAHSVRYLYLMHYFGVLQQEGCISRIAELKRKYRLTVIEDTTHSLFTERGIVGDYGVASLRKWFPIPDGGVLYAPQKELLPQKPQEKKPASQKVTAMLLKRLYLTEGFDCNAKYREIFAKEEEAFGRQTGVYGISDMACFLLSHFPVGAMRSARRRNTAQLLEGLHRLGYEAAIDIKPSDVLLALPIYTRKRDCLRSLLMERKVYCAVHWPLVRQAAYGDSRWMGRHILSLPIDQRYREKDMEYLLDCLETCRKEGGPL